ncbi:uncharacterized protein ACNS7B_009258 isoform 1-T3 [Menidia menidia]
MPLIPADALKPQESKEWSLSDFKSHLAKILTETEESDLDKLVRDFIVHEDVNYTLLNFINCQHNEAESLRRKISQLHREMKEFAAEQQRKQEQSEARWKTVSKKQEATERQLGVYEQRLELKEELFSQLQEGLRSLLQICYSSSVACEKLDSSDGFQAENISLCLRMVEDRVNELFTLQSYHHCQKNLSPWDTVSLNAVAVKLVGIKPQAGKVTVTVAKPLHDTDVESLPLGAVEPMSKEALLSAVCKRVREKSNVHPLK